MAKFTFARQLHHAIEWCRTARRALVTVRRETEDDPAIGVLRELLRAVAPAADRLRMLHMISDLTARDFGGYHAVLAVHAEGSIEARRCRSCAATTRLARCATPSDRRSGLMTASV